MMADVRRRITSAGGIAGVNIVPVIDLCLVLLVVLLIISPLLSTPPVKVDLPGALKDEKSERATISVSLDTEGNIAVNDKRVESRDILGLYLQGVAAKEQMVQPIVLLRTDKNLPYGAVTDIIAVLKEAGFNDIALATRPLDETAESAPVPGTEVLP